jgi:hypothetical protein
VESDKSALKFMEIYKRSRIKQSCNGTEVKNLHYLISEFRLMVQ